MELKYIFEQKDNINIFIVTTHLIKKNKNFNFENKYFQLEVNNSIFNI